MEQCFLGTATELSANTSKEEFEHNESLREYVKDYLREEKVTFSLLPTGPWGSGKTYFVKGLIDELKKEKRTVLYVSLNGIDRVETLERAILGAFVPDVVMGAGQLLLAAGNIFDGPWTKICKQVKGLIEQGTSKTSKRLRRVKKYAIVFDDVERCQMPLKVWSGYITSLTDGLCLPTILIGNEAELFKTEGYEKIKEKFVGQTFQLATSIEMVLPSLFREIGWPADFPCRELHTECCKLFRKVEETHGAANYRAFKGALWQLKYWCEKLNDCLRERKDSPLFLHFALLFLALAYHTQLGYLTEKSWDEGFNVQKKDGEKGKSANEKKNLTFLSVLSECAQLWPELLGYSNPMNSFFNSRYIFSYNHLFDCSYWKKLILVAPISPTVISEALRQSSYFHEPRAWEKLYYYPRLETSELEQGLKDLQEVIDHCEFKDCAELRMTFGLKEAILHLRFNAMEEEDGNWADVQKEVLEEYKQCMDRYCRENEKESTKPSDTFGDSVNGCLIPGATEETSLYRQMSQYMYEKYTQGQKEDSLSILRSGDWESVIELFGRKSLHSTVILQEDSQIVRHLVELFTGVPNNKRWELRRVLDCRYRVNISNWRDFLGKLSPECKVWERIIEGLKQRQEQMKKQRHVDYAKIMAVKDLANYLKEKIVNRLRECEELKSKAVEATTLE